MEKTLKTGYKARANWRTRYTKFFPCISLSGDWLHDAGFEIGQNIIVSIQNNQIIITPSK